MKKKLQIFISSTYTDLKEERQAAVEAVLRSGNIPAGMELFTAGDQSQLETITRWIDDSDIYMLILGGRYGSIEPTTGNSYTEVEYDYAKSNNKPLFAVVISDEFLNEKVKKEGLSVNENDNPQKYKAFRSKVLSNMSVFYNSPNDIKLAVHETLADFKDRHEFSGWVPGEMENKLEEMKEENESLRKELQQLKMHKDQKILSKNEQPNEQELDREFEIIYSDFESKYLDYQIDGLKSKANINYFVSSCYPSMITGVYNKFGMSELMSVLFFSVMPYLNLFELAEIEMVPKASYRRFYLTNKGKKYAVFLNKKNTLKSLPYK